MCDQFGKQGSQLLPLRRIQAAQHARLHVGHQRGNTRQRLLAFGRQPEQFAAPVALGG